MARDLICHSITGYRRHWAVDLVLTVDIIWMLFGGFLFGCHALFRCIWVIVRLLCGHHRAIIGVWLVVVIGCEAVIILYDTVITVSYCALTVVIQPFNIPYNLLALWLTW